jgi:hypothetical protein
MWTFAYRSDFARKIRRTLAPYAEFLLNLCSSQGLRRRMIDGACMLTFIGLSDRWPDTGERRDEID